MQDATIFENSCTDAKREAFGILLSSLTFDFSVCRWPGSKGNTVISSSSGVETGNDGFCDSGRSVHSLEDDGVVWAVLYLLRRMRTAAVVHADSSDVRK